MICSRERGGCEDGRYQQIAMVPIVMGERERALRRLSCVGKRVAHGGWVGKKKAKFGLGGGVVVHRGCLMGGGKPGIVINLRGCKCNLPYKLLSGLYLYCL